MKQCFWFAISKLAVFTPASGPLPYSTATSPHIWCCKHLVSTPDNLQNGIFDCTSAISNDIASSPVFKENHGG